MRQVDGTHVPVDILHRLALGVEPLDALTGVRLGPPLRVLEETPGPDPHNRRRRERHPLAELSTLRSFETSGTGRYKLRLTPRVRRTFTVRLLDHSRQRVPRRFSVEVWGVKKKSDATIAAAEDVTLIDEDPVPPQAVWIPASSRTLRPWLWPGAAYPLPKGTTGIRGRVIRAGAPVRWPRVEAVRRGTNRVLARAHGDERGEFLLAVPMPDGMWPPGQGQVRVDLVIWAAPAAPPPTSDDLAARALDPLADLPVETVPRSSNPPTPADLDNPTLRGEAVPPTYVTSAARPQVDLAVGELFTPSAAYSFVQP